MLNVNDLDYQLPDEAIARTPARPRDSAKLLVLKRSDPAFAQHATVRQLPDLLAPSDLLIVNTTRVIPARLVGYRADTQGAVEGLYLGLAGDGNDPRRWRVLLRGRRMKPDITINLTDEAGADTLVRLALRASEQEGEGAATWTVEVFGAKDAATATDILSRVGRTPLPPYILGSRKRNEDRVPDAADREGYQCVYAGPDAGSVAAPTAGLHFTPELLGTLKARGVKRAEVTLHVGTGTFKPVETEFVEQHTMHPEWCAVPASLGGAIDNARAASGRAIAVGTTTARTLESFTPDELRQGGQKQSRLLITPGFSFRNLDALMTNFHLPRSTLMSMVGAFLDERGGGVGNGVERLKAAYTDAITRGYRFYSYGDAMLIMP